MNKFQKALLDIQEERVCEYDMLAREFPIHKYSNRYLRRRKQIIHSLQTKKSFWGSDLSFKRARRISFRTMLVAVIVMIMATASVIAITKPQIYYDILKLVDRWKITFNVEGELEDEEFVPVKPIIPDGFEVTTEEVRADSYMLIMQDKDGEEIFYEQSLPMGTSIFIDNERSTNKVVDYKGKELLISRDNDLTSIVYNDGKYVFYIDGKGDEKKLFQIIEYMF